MMSVITAEGYDGEDNFTQKAALLREQEQKCEALRQELSREIESLAAQVAQKLQSGGTAMLVEKNGQEGWLLEQYPSENIAFFVIVGVDRSGTLRNFQFEALPRKSNMAWEREVISITYTKLDTYGRLMRAYNLLTAALS